MKIGLFKVRIAITHSEGGVKSFAHRNEMVNFNVVWLYLAAVHVL